MVEVTTNPFEELRSLVDDEGRFEVGEGETRILIEECNDVERGGPDQTYLVLSLGYKITGLSERGIEGMMHGQPALAIGEVAIPSGLAELSDKQKAELARERITKIFEVLEGE